MALAALLVMTSSIFCRVNAARFVWFLLHWWTGLRLGVLCSVVSPRFMIQVERLFISPLVAYKFQSTAVTNDNCSATPTPAAGLQERPSTAEQRHLYSAQLTRPLSVLVSEAHEVMLYARETLS